MQEAIANYRFYSQVRVRFAETDANGHMSHVSMVIYMEQGRCEFLEGLGLFHPEQMQTEQKTFVLASQQVDYKNQAYYNDVLRVYCRASRLGRSSMDIDYVIVNPEKQLVIAAGTSTVVHFDAKTQKSIPLPDDLQERIGQLEMSFATVS